MYYSFHCISQTCDIQLIATTWNFPQEVHSVLVGGGPKIYLTPLASLGDCEDTKNNDVKVVVNLTKLLSFGSYFI